MSIIADRGLFVRLLVQSGRFDTPGAESFADAVDAATREPASKGDLETLRHDVKLESASIRSEFVLLSERVEAKLDKHLIRLGGLGLALAGLLFAALRLT